MAFTDNPAGRVIEWAPPAMKITLAADVRAGDLLAYNGGWVLANASLATTADATLIAGERGVSGQIIAAYPMAVISGITTGTAGNPLYLSDTAGQYSASAGTIAVVVGIEMGDGRMMAKPQMRWIGLVGSTYTQTYSTADKFHAARTATAIAALDAAAAAAATATSIVAAVPANPPNVDEDGIAAGGFITRATRIALVNTVINLLAHSNEMDLDYEALLVDVADIRTKYAAAVTLANELKVDLDALRADQLDTAQALNALIDDLQAVGLVG